MKKFIITTITILALAITGTAFAMDMEGHDMDSSDKFGTLFHTTHSEGYTLAYYLMDLRTQEGAVKEMEKPHHIMVYITDKDHKPVTGAKAGFMIQNEARPDQKAMAMAMGDGFGITADMKHKGNYTIICKAVIGDKTLMDKFSHTME